MDTVVSDKTELPLCVACREPIKPGARVCTHCGTFQSRWRSVAAFLKWAGGAVTVLTLLFGVQNLNGLYRAHQERQAAVRDLVAGGDLLANAGDYRRAWTLFQEALALDPSSALVRKGQVELAMEWLPNARVFGEESYAAIVNDTLPVLTRGVATASDERAADLLALVGWAYYLERKDRGASMVDITSFYQKALVRNPDCIYALAFLGHWAMTEMLNLADGLTYFQHALATGVNRPFVRQYQWAALSNLSGLSKTREDLYIKCLQEILRMGNDMRKHGEDDLSDGQRTALLRCYWEHNSADQVEEMLPALPIEEHLQLIDWLLQGLGQERSNAYVVQQSRFSKARLHEILNEKEVALAEYRVLESELDEWSPLRKPLKEAFERLDGTDGDSMP